MEKKRLLETLKELRAELSQADDVDPQTLAQLEKLTSDLEREFGKRDVPRDAEIEPASNGLKDLLLKYESEHPQLSVALGKVADALAAMGI